MTKQNDVQNDVLLKVSNLCQYFRLGGRDFKAVDGISFEIKKGEVLGIVGESGCGKTTTGRAIIKLYDATSGDVYFKGQRIVAGTRSYKDAIAKAKKQAKAQITQLKDEFTQNSQSMDEAAKAAAKTEMDAKIAEINAKLNAVVAEQKANIKSAIYDHTKSEKEYQRKNVAAVDAKYSQLLADTAGVRSCKNIIAETKNNAKIQVKQLSAEFAQQAKGLDEGAKASAKAELDAKIAEVNANRDKIIAEQTELMQAAKQHKAEQTEDVEKYKQLQREYIEARRIAQNERIVTEIQMIFQDPMSSLDPRMTVREIISEGLIVKGVRDPKVIDEEVTKMLETVGLVGEHANRYQHEFSGGQRQRIGVARAIIMKPSLIIADEPVSALDVSIQAQVINLLNDIREKLGLTILFIAHDLSVVKYFSDRIAVMYYGKIVEMADSAELFKNPLHPYTRSLLSAIPLPDPNYEKQRKRISYNPFTEHDYSKEPPSMQEVCPGHQVYCNSVELEKYKAMLKK